MSAQVASLPWLRLEVADGFVHTGPHRSGSAGVPVEEFVGSAGPGSAYLVSGSPESSGLVARLCVCPSVVVRTHSPLRGSSWSDTVPVGPEYAPVYRVRSAVWAAGGWPDAWALSVFRDHPAWRAFAFLPGVDLAAACCVVAAVGDLRWYRDPLRPHRLSRLLRFLGVTHRGPVSGRPSRRFGDLTAAWYARPGLSAADRGDPANFLWRVYDGEARHEEGLVAAGLRLAAFFAAVWGWHGEFSPRLFFAKDGAARHAFTVYSSASRSDATAAP